MNIDQAEKDKFNKIAEEWWDPSGKFAPLHKINPLRSNYINDKKNVNNLEVLDVACGGGLLTEALYDFGAQVTGVDISEVAIETAKLHASKSNKVLAQHGELRRLSHEGPQDCHGQPRHLAVSGS